MEPPLQAGLGILYSFAPWISGVGAESVTSRLQAFHRNTQLATICFANAEWWILIKLHHNMGTEA